MAELFDILTVDTASDAVLDVSEVFEPIVSLTTVERVAGLYTVEVTFLPIYADILRFIAYKTTGDIDSTEFFHTNTALTDKEQIIYTGYINHIGGVFNLVLEVRKESALGSQLDIAEATISFKRIG